MKDSLDFVRGAVATKDLIPILTNFHIYNGRIQGTNGRLTIDAPCPELAEWEFTVPATAFLKAVDACSSEPVIKLDEGYAVISKGSFKCRLPLDDHNTFPRQEPAGDDGDGLNGALLPALKLLRPFVADDASRPWACGVLFKDGEAFATNNITAVGIPAVRFPEPINLPVFLIDELLRIGLEPVKVQASINNITMVFANGSWIKSSLLAATWPDVSGVLPTVVTGTVVSADLIAGVQTVLPFCPDIKSPLIHLSPDGIGTSEGEKSAMVGGFDLPKSIFRAEPLLATLRAASKIDFSTYPAPCPFVGDNGLRGVLVGVKVA